MYRYTLPITLKDSVLSKQLLANGEGALLYAGGKLNVGPQNDHKDNLYGKKSYMLTIHCSRYFVLFVEISNGARSSYICVRMCASCNYVYICVCMCIVSL
jgi:hypothetical protein